MQRLPPARAHLLAAGASLVLAVLLAWPAVRTLTARLWGDSGDAWQNWWNGWWFGEAVASGQWPMHTPLLWHPDGVSLWLHTLGPLNAALTALGQALLPGFAGYNLLILLHLAFGAYGGFVLARALLLRAKEAGRLGALDEVGLFLAALAGGVAFGFSPYTWAHVSAHLHLTSLGFVALFAHALLQALTRPGLRWPLLAGLWGLFTALSGWYLLLDEVLVGGAFALAAVLGVRRHGWAPLLRVAGAGAFTGLLILPLILPTLAAQDQPLEGTHDPRVFSADLLSLWLPAPAQALGRLFTATTLRFTGNSGENAGYLGYLALLFTGVAALRVRGRGLYLLLGAGLVSVVLSLGPALHVGGRVHDAPGLPYAWLARVLPFLDGLGVPVRFALVMNLALAAGVALGLGWLASRLQRPMAARSALLVGAGLVLLEYAPAGQVTTRYPAPDWLAALGDSGEDFALVDLTGWTHPLYNQTLHGKPILHGYSSRRPIRLLAKLRGDPILGPIYGEVLEGRIPGSQPALERVDPVLDFRWGTAGPAPGVQPDFTAEWSGTLKVPRAGTWRFVLGSDDGAALYVGGRRVVDNGGLHPYREVAGDLELGEGAHPVRVTFQDAGGAAALVLRWAGPGIEEAVVPTLALRTPDGRPGLLGRYRHRAAALPMSREEAWAHLRRRWGVRYVLAYEHEVPWLVRHGLGLDKVAASEGLVLYEVPRAP